MDPGILTGRKFESFCFCCLTEDGIFNDLLQISSKTKVQLVECYTACSGIAPDLETPKKICSACESKLKFSFEFRELCRASYQKLTEVPVSLPEIIVDVKHEVFSGDEEFNEVVQATSLPLNEVFIKTEHHKVAEKPKKVTKPKKPEKEQTDYPTVPDNTTASDLEAEFLCFHCDIIIPTFREYRKHSEQHGASGGGKRVAKVCEMCNQETATFVSHIKDKHPHYKPFKCKFCVRQFQNAKQLKMHLIVHATAQTQIECKKCHKIFDRDILFRNHIQEHEENNRKKVYFCPTCGLTFDQYQPLHEHIEANHERTKAFPCFYCKKVFRVRDLYLRHKCSNEIVKPDPDAAIFSCDRCLKSFVYADEMFCHKVVFCNEPDLHHCDICNKNYPSKIRLQDHTRLIHRDKVYRVCEICGYKAKAKSPYEYHMASHKNEQDYPCPRENCGKTFKNQTLLKNHVRAHDVKDGTVEKPYQCDICKRAFLHHSYIKRHMAAHSESLRPFMCTVCGKRYPVASVLEAHMNTHLNRLKTIKCPVCPNLYVTQKEADIHYKTIHVNTYYTCKYCDYKTKTASSFREHLFKHRGLYPYECPMCPIKYIHQYNYRKHLKNKHKTMFDKKIHNYVEQEKEMIGRLVREAKRTDLTSIIMPTKKPAKRKRRAGNSDSDDN